MTNRRTSSTPTWGSWLQDGGTLLGITPQRQAELKAQASGLAQKAAKGIETAEAQIRGFEAKARAGFKNWRDRQ